MCNYENKNDDRRVLTQRNAARYGKEETVKIPAYYQMIGVNAFQSNIKIEKPVTAKWAAGDQHERVPVQQGAPEVALPHSIYRVGNGCFAECPSFVLRICRMVWKKFQRICSGLTGGCKRFFLPKTVK